MLTDSTRRALSAARLRQPHRARRGGGRPCRADPRRAGRRRARHDLPGVARRAGDGHTASRPAPSTRPCPSCRSRAGSPKGARVAVTLEPATGRRALRGRFGSLPSEPERSLEASSRTGVPSSNASIHRENGGVSSKLGIDQRRDRNTSEAEPASRSGECAGHLGGERPCRNLFTARATSVHARPPSSPRRRRVPAALRRRGDEDAEEKLFGSGLIGFNPKWAPHGDPIAFVRDEDIHVVASSGRAVRNLTNHANAHQPELVSRRRARLRGPRRTSDLRASPHRTTRALHTPVWPPRVPGDRLRVPLLASSTVALITLAALHLHVRTSACVLHSRSRSRLSAPSPTRRIYSSSSTGEGDSPTGHGALLHNPTWSPTRTIVFTSTRGDNGYDIFSIAADAAAGASCS